MNIAQWQPEKERKTDRQTDRQGGQADDKTLFAALFRSAERFPGAQNVNTEQLESGNWASLVTLKITCQQQVTSDYQYLPASKSSSLAWPSSSSCTSRSVICCSTHRYEKHFYVFIIFHKTRFSFFLGQLNLCYSSTTNCRIMLTFISVFAIFGDFARIKLQYWSFSWTLITLPQCHVRYCFRNSFSTGPNNFANNVFYSTLVTFLFNS